MQGGFSRKADGGAMVIFAAADTKIADGLKSSVPSRRQ